MTRDGLKALVEQHEKAFGVTPGQVTCSKATAREFMGDNPMAAFVIEQGGSVVLWPDAPVLQLIISNRMPYEAVVLE